MCSPLPHRSTKQSDRVLLSTSANNSTDPTPRSQSGSAHPSTHSRHPTQRKDTAARWRNPIIANLIVSIIVFSLQFQLRINDVSSLLFLYVLIPRQYSPDPPDPKHQGVQPSLGENVTEGAKKDILNFPIFHFKAKQAKPIEVKPKRVKNVKAEKGKKGRDDITKYFYKSADTTKARPIQQKASQLSPSVSKHQNECDQAEFP